MAVKYIPYFPDTLEGQAILDNFTRTRRVLQYRDCKDVLSNIRRGLPLYEVSEQERVGKNERGNIIMRGECLSACAYLKDRGIKVDLVYIDPPFASGADYAKKVYIRRNPKVAEAIRRVKESVRLLDDGESPARYVAEEGVSYNSELGDETLKSFEEKMYGDVWKKEDYLNWMYENLMAIKSVMSETGSIYVHLDWHIGHYVKILMDEVFGEENFRNEIIWQKIRTTKSQSSNFGNVHDAIYCYSKSPSHTFANVYAEYSDDYVHSHYKRDANGRLYTDVSLVQKGTGPARVFNGKLINPPSGMHWIWSQENINKAITDGRIMINSNGTPRKIQYLDEMKGDIISDLWTDIFPINSQAKEDADYVTQKPEALLERIIKASSDEGMVVADFFGGSGVTAKVANDLGRRFIHNDIGLNSIQTTRDRLLAACAEFSVMEIRDGVSLYRNPVQTMEKLKSLIPGLRNEDSLDKFWEGSIVDSQDGMMPVYLPNLLDSSTRVLDKPLINRLIHEALPDLPDDVKKVIVYYVDIANRWDMEKFIKEQNTETLIDIELRDLKQVLDDVVVEDEVEWSLSPTKDGVFDTWTVEIKSFSSDRVLQKIEAVNLKGQQQTLSGTKSKFTPIRISEEGLETVEWLSLDCTDAEKSAPWHSDVEIKIDRLGYVSLNGRKTDRFWDGTITSTLKPLRLKVRNICGDETTVVL